MRKSIQGEVRAMRFRRHWLALAAAASLLPFQAALSQSGAVPVVRGEIIRDFARVTFEWPVNVYLNAETNGDVALLHFERKLKPDFAPMLATLSPYIARADIMQDGKTVRLKMKGDYRIRSFVSGTINGIDILNIEGTGNQAAQSASPAAPVSAKSMAALSPSAGDEAQKPAEPKAAKPSEKPKKTTPPSKNQEPEAQPAPEMTKKPEDAEKPVSTEEPKAPAETTKPETPEQPAEAAPSPKPDVLNVYASTAGGRTTLRFAWPLRTAAAAFVRGSHGWIVFDHKLPVELDALKETAASIYPNITEIPHPSATVLRITLPQGSGMSASRKADSHEWSVQLVNSFQPPPLPLQVAVNTLPPLPPHVFIPSAEPSATLTLEDPQLGDTLLVTPSHKSGEGIATRRGFVEFNLLESAQGVVVQKIADAAQVQTVRDGLRIGTERGAQLGTPPERSEAPAKPELPEASPKTDDPAQTPQNAPLFPQESWRLAPDTTLLASTRDMQMMMSLIPDGVEKNRLRMRLAQTLLGGGMAVDALAVVQEMKRISPDFYISSRAAAVSGAARFMMGRFADAAEDFSVPELGDGKEAAYWRAMLAELLGKPEQKFSYAEMNADYFSKYPQRLRQKLAIVAADRAVNNEEYSEALQILQTLVDDKVQDGIESYADYITGRAALATGKETEGLELLEKRASDYHNPGVRAQAEFALISHLATKEPEKISELRGRLERLRFAWRGDNLELETLKMLTEIYTRENNLLPAMHAWRDIISDFPSTVAAAEALKKMQTSFVQIFDNQGEQALSPFEQLALYYEFRSLTPADAVGDRIVNTVAERLIDMDLLEQAVALLDYRMRYLYTQSARSRAGAKLAQAHLLNRQPEKALAALQNSLYGSNPEDLRRTRDHLAAQAMVELERYTEATELLQNDTSAEAEDIRQRIHWKKKDWPKFIASLESELKMRKDTTQPVSTREADKLVQLALAYVAVNDTAQVQFLRDYFTPLMQEMPDRQALFTFITEPELVTSPETLPAVLKQVEDTRSFLAGYKIHPVFQGIPTPTQVLLPKTKFENAPPPEQAGTPKDGQVQEKDAPPASPEAESNPAETTPEEKPVAPENNPAEAANPEPSEGAEKTPTDPPAASPSP